MLISHKSQFIVINIPKTGTRSIRETLKTQCILDVVGEPNPNSKFYQHETSNNIKKVVTEQNWNWKEYYSFVCVRNPWKRYLSFFKYYMEYAEKYKNKDNNIMWNNAEIAQGEMCVELFKKNKKEVILKNIILNNKPQSEYYLDQHKNVMVNHIAKFENLNSEFKKLCNKLRIDSVNLLHENKSDFNFDCDIYSQELIDMVAKKENHVINLKGYDFV